MKVCHFTAYNGSGMNQVAETFARADRARGLDAHILNIHEQGDWSVALDADVHVAHTHWPDFYHGKSFRRMLTKAPKIVTIFHGTPEFVIRDTLNQSRHNNKHGNGDGIMMMLHWLAQSDARVTFWPRHQAILQSMVDRGTEIHCIPMGIDRAFWQAGLPEAKWAGSPSVLSCENPHFIKDPLDLILLWPWVYPQLENASLNLGYVAENQHRQYSSIINRNDAGYGMHWSAFTWGHERLRSILKSVDFYVGLVRYGDFNRMSHEANVAGTRTISYRGNPYSDFWITEGDQREMARELLSILRGDVAPRAKASVPDASETAEHMEGIYKGVLERTYAPGFTLPFAPCKVWPPLNASLSVIDTRSEDVKRSAAESASVATTAAVSMFEAPPPMPATSENAFRLRVEASMSYRAIAFRLGVSRHVAHKLVAEGIRLDRRQREKRSRTARPRKTSSTKKARR